MRPTASIIVPTSRDGVELDRCIRALLRLTGSFAREIIVVDNHVRPTVADRAGVRLVHEPRPGAYVARNAGLAAASADVCLFTDSDCEVHPSWASRLLDALGDRAVVGAGTEIAGSPLQPGLLPHFARTHGVLAQRRTMRRPKPYLQTASFGVRTKDARSVGGFDASLRSGGDADFCWRLVKRCGGAMALVDEPLVWHHHRTSLGGLLRQYHRYGRGRAGLVRRHGTSLPDEVRAAGADALKLAAVPALSTWGFVRAIRRADPVFAVAPWLQAAQLVGKRSGELRGWLLDD